MRQNFAVGYLYKTVSGSRPNAGEDAIRCRAAQIGYRISTVLALGVEDGDHMERVLAALRRFDAVGVITYSLDHLDGTPRRVTAFAELFTVVPEQHWRWGWRPGDNQIPTGAATLRPHPRPHSGQRRCDLIERAPPVR